MTSLITPALVAWSITLCSYSYLVHLHYVRAFFSYVILIGIVMALSLCTLGSHLVDTVNNEHNVTSALIKYT
jgi:hypothetical protein